MKRFLSALALVAVAAPAVADVGVSVSIGQPGFYGRLDIGDYYPAPVLLYPQPVIIQRGPMMPPPIYLHVPPGHAKNWAKHCRRYDACGRPVYFVQDRWYNDVYVPRYREQHYGGPGGYERRGDGWRGDERRGDDRRGDGWRGDDRRGGDRGDRDNGPGRGNGGDHGRGHGRGRD